jgi:pimeloyl-ACP methyl ester carboxylesterase
MNTTWETLVQFRLVPAILLVAAMPALVRAQVEVPWTDRSRHTISYVTASPGVDIEVLDWRGNGVPLMLLSAGRQVLSSLERSDYRAVRVPTMAIYQPMTLRSLYPNVEAFDAATREVAERQVRDARIWWQRSIDQYRGEATTNAHVVLLDSGGHHVLLTNADEVSHLILSFLADLPGP